MVQQIKSEAIALQNITLFIIIMHLSNILFKFTPLNSCQRAVLVIKPAYFV